MSQGSGRCSGKQRWRRPGASARCLGVLLARRGRGGL